MNPNFRMTDPYNLVHIMSFSGARGNVSQVHQLVGMRGLMSDLQGQMIDVPIPSNLREGLSLIEYIISCYGARKGVIDTAIRTSDAGYLMRRLIKVVQHIVVRRTDCGALRGISVSPRNDVMPGKIFIQTLIGRVLADDIYMGSRCVATQNQDIRVGLANRFITFRTQPISIRTPFTCRSMPWICQLCYGRSPTHGNLVELGEAVGIIAGQSIGEPGTQLTLRTFHTSGVFSGDIAEHVRAASNGKIKFSEDLVHPTRTRYGHPAFLCYIELYVTIESEDILHNVNIALKSCLLVQNHQYVESEQVIAEIRAGASTLNLKKRVQKHIDSDSDGEMHWSTDVYHAPEFTYSNVHLLPKTSRLWILSRRPYRSSVVTFSLRKDQDQTNRRRNRFIIPFQLSQKRDKELMPLSHISIEIPINSIFHRNSIFAYFDDPRYRRKSSGIIKYGIIEMDSIVKKQEDFVDPFFFIPEEAHILLRSSPITVRNNSIIGVDTQITLNIRSRVGGVVRTDKISRHSSIFIPRGKTNSKKSKNLENGIYVQWITPTKKKKLFVLAISVVTYEITDGLNLATLFPQDLFQERDNMQLRVVNYIFYGNGKATRKISDIRTKVHGHYEEIIYEGDTLVTFIYEKSRSGDITQDLPKVEQVLEVQSMDSISKNLEKRIYGWNKHITRILGISWGFLIGAELTIAQSRISLDNKIQRVYRSQGVPIHNRHIEIIVQTARVLAKAAPWGRIDWLKGLKENVVLGGDDTCWCWIQRIRTSFKSRKKHSLENQKKRIYSREK
ncbi:hypothetical protein Cgig2_032223 [Carnegiea gigantea]|uniref:DNA-directed RNA polymerase n=1 Tax=Carnegiea gigantea TaxID=171969 RepID=A0A9Q1GVN7_9CARY|nr:hypothetical protein Cgig2_032223 [Carnegiea gigantea]